MIYGIIIAASIVILTIVAIIAPLGVQLNAELYSASETMRADLSPNFSSSPSVAESINNATAAGLKGAEANIISLSFMYQYGWIFVLVVVGIIGFLFTRTMVERQSSYGGLI